MGVRYFCDNCDKDCAALYHHVALDKDYLFCSDKCTEEFIDKRYEQD